MTLVINKMDEIGLNNTACHECLPKKTNNCEVILATEGVLTI